MKLVIPRIPFLPTWLVLMAALYGSQLPEPIREVYIMGLACGLWLGSFANYAFARANQPSMTWTNALVAILWPAALVLFAAGQTRALIIKRRRPAPPSE